MPRPLVPCLWLDDQAEAAAAFYTATLPDGRVTSVARDPSGQPPGGVLTVEFEVAGQRFTARDGGPAVTINPTISCFVHVDTVDAARALFAALADGGAALMPLDRYPWSPCYGWAQDRFGMTWQVMAERRPPGGSTIVPCLMFAGPQHGRAEAAMRAYTGIFPDSHVDTVVRYEDGEGPVDTTKHGRFTLAGHELVAMDSHLAQDLTFGEGVSLQVRCADQAEVERYRTALAEGGRTSAGGWLTDRFGVRWQVVDERVGA